ncbi:MAG: metal-dependent hydrolase [Fimbriiglobus sp.]|jgi:membrane-bound metal-dependent hydrolase YbcI (DUF457 family)|nr:metal-dependent hydrolase [Fimbriiglobus sp.]
MAGFRTHIAVSTACGVAAGVTAAIPLKHAPETAFLVGTLTAVGGMLPDLDSDSGKPLRELSSLAAAVLPMLLYTRLKDTGLTHEGVLAILVGAYLVIRYGVVHLFKHVTVHRGMFHSIPAMFIAGLAVYLAYDCPAALQSVRYVLAGGVMLGFLSHLILDEIWSVGFDGVVPKLKASAGSAFKLFSSSVWGTAVCYGMLGALGFLAYKDYQHRLGHGTEPIGLHIPGIPLPTFGEKHSGALPVVQNSLTAGTAPD